LRTVVGQYQSRLNAVDAVLAAQLGESPSSALTTAYDTTTSATTQAGTSAGTPAPATQAAQPALSTNAADRRLFPIFRELDYDDFTEDNYPRTRIVNSYLDDNAQVDQATVRSAYDRFVHQHARSHSRDRDEDEDEREPRRRPAGRRDRDEDEDERERDAGHVKQTNPAHDGIVSEPPERHSSAEGFPSTLPPNATRALVTAGYSQLVQLANLPEAELAALKGVGPASLEVLDKALKDRGLPPLRR
jgi:hypothetical protein